MSGVVINGQKDGSDVSRYIYAHFGSLVIHLKPLSQGVYQQYPPGDIQNPRPIHLSVDSDGLSGTWGHGYPFSAEDSSIQEPNYFKSMLFPTGRARMWYSYIDGEIRDVCAVVSRNPPKNQFINWSIRDIVVCDSRAFSLGSVVIACSVVRDEKDKRTLRALLAVQDVFFFDGFSLPSVTGLPRYVSVALDAKTPKVVKTIKYEPPLRWFGMDTREMCTPSSLFAGASADGTLRCTFSCYYPTEASLRDLMNPGLLDYMEVSIPPVGEPTIAIKKFRGKEVNTLYRTPRPVFVKGLDPWIAGGNSEHSWGFANPAHQRTEDKISDGSSAGSFYGSASLGVSRDKNGAFFEHVFTAMESKNHTAFSNDSVTYFSSGSWTIDRTTVDLPGDDMQITTVIVKDTAEGAEYIHTRHFSQNSKAVYKVTLWPGYDLLVYSDTFAVSGSSRRTLLKTITRFDNRVIVTHVSPFSEVVTGEAHGDLVEETTNNEGNPDIGGGDLSQVAGVHYLSPELEVCLFTRYRYIANNGTGVRTTRTELVLIQSGGETVVVKSSRTESEPPTSLYGISLSYDGDYYGADTGEAFRSITRDWRPVFTDMILNSMTYNTDINSDANNSTLIKIGDCSVVAIVMDGKLVRVSVNPPFTAGSSHTVWDAIQGAFPFEA